MAALDFRDAAFEAADNCWMRAELVDVRRNRGQAVGMRNVSTSASNSRRVTWR